MKAPLFCKEYYQKTFPTTPDKIRYELRTFRSGGDSHNNDERQGGADKIILVMISFVVFF
jgi:hypothetical protein